MKLAEILAGADVRKRRKRIGRGIGSGRGKTCGRGHKGMGARAGARKRLNYEGGQTPALLRIPRRGFSNAQFRKEFQLVNVGSLNRFDDGTQVDAPALAEARLIEDAGKPVKVLGNGEITKKLTVIATKFSSAAAEKITQAGGTVQNA